MGSLLERYLEEPAGQANAVLRHEHRPWPLPSTSWLMGQSWRELLFAHWPVEAELLRPIVPDALPIDEFDGMAWLGVTPFRVEALRMRGMLPLPRVSTFPELNIRTYATIDGKPGVVFLRLDTPNRLAIAAARRAYELPYAYSSIAMQTDEASGHTSVSASRDDGSLQLEYHPTGPVFHAEPGTLDYFLTERYRLYTTDANGEVRWAEIHHEPWPLQVGVASVQQRGYLPGALELRGDPIVHVARRQDVVIWPLDGPPE